MNLASRRPMRVAASTADTPITARNWRKYAACTGNPDLFFPDSSNRSLARIQERQAQQVCFRCPVKAMCGTWALDEGVEAGVWGGMTPRGRNRVLRGQGRATATLALEAWAMDPDPEAVKAYRVGERSDVEDVDRLAAIGAGVRDGMTYREFDTLHELSSGATAGFVRQMRQAFAEAGYDFPFTQVAVSGKRSFTDIQARQIRERFATGEVDVRQLAKDCGVDRKTITSLLTGASYPNAGGPLLERKTSSDGSGTGPVVGLRAQDMEVAA